MGGTWAGMEVGECQGPGRNHEGQASGKSVGLRDQRQISALTDGLIIHSFIQHICTEHLIGAALGMQPGENP